MKALNINHQFKPTVTTTSQTWISHTNMQTMLQAYKNIGWAAWLRLIELKWKGYVNVLLTMHNSIKNKNWIT